MDSLSGSKISIFPYGTLIPARRNNARRECSHAMHERIKQPTDSLALLERSAHVVIPLAGAGTMRGTYSGDRAAGEGLGVSAERLKT
eukprot:1670601-Prymnesium_polylepis.1